MYCFAIVGEWCWARVEAAYTGAATDARREAALHVFCALADAAPHERVPPALAALLRHAVAQAEAAPHARTLRTALDALGQCPPPDARRPTRPHPASRNCSSSSSVHVPCLQAATRRG